jgi:hypothetical protein
VLEGTIELQVDQTSMAVDQDFKKESKGYKALIGLEGS